MTQIARDLNLMDSHIRIVNWRNLRHLDWILVVLVGALAYMGLSNMYSASYGYEGAESTPHFARQALFLGIGTVVALIIVCIDYRFLVALAPLIYAAAILALLAQQAVLQEGGHAVLAGWSRKSSLGAVLELLPPGITDVDHRCDLLAHDRSLASVAAALLAVEKGARIVRVHDVAATRQALAVWEAMARVAA